MTIVLVQRLFATYLIAGLSDEKTQRLKMMTLVAVAAHEIAHIRQYKIGLTSKLTGEELELDADNQAGTLVVLGLGTPSDAKTIAEVGDWYAENAGLYLFSNGDYEFDNKLHHGTKAERLAKFAAGINLGVKAQMLNLELRKTSSQLHVCIDFQNNSVSSSNECKTSDLLFKPEKDLTIGPATRKQK
jgi:hypothetical protein